MRANVRSRHDAYYLDNLSNANEEVLNRIEALTGKRPLFYQGDIRDEKRLATILLSTLFNQ